MAEVIGSVGADYQFAQSGVGNRTISLTKPAGTALGDLIILLSHSTRFGIGAYPSGFTNIGLGVSTNASRWNGNQMGTSILWKRATASEPATYGWTGDFSLNINDVAQMIGQVIVFRGLDRSDGTKTEPAPGSQTHAIHLTGVGATSSVMPSGPAAVACGNGFGWLARRPGLLLFTGAAFGEPTSYGAPPGMTSINGSGSYSLVNMTNSIQTAYQLRHMGLGATSKTGTPSGSSGDGWSALLLQIAEPGFIVSD